MATNYVSPPHQLILGHRLEALQATYALNDALGTKAFCVQFQAPESQTNANLVLYLLQTATTGSPTSIRASIYTVLATNGNRTNASAGTAVSDVDCSSASPAWRTFTMTGVTLVANRIYIIVIDNQTGTPAGNYPTFARAGGIGTALGQAFRASVTASDPSSVDITWTGPAAPCVLKFSSGLIIGNPLGGVAAHATNMNWRGNRYKVAAPVVVRGAFLADAAGATANNYFTFTIYGTDGTSLATGNAGVGPRQDTVYLATPYTMVPGVSYDCVFAPADSTSVGTVGYAGVASPPADVTSAMPQSGGVQNTYLDGATPGSFTPDATRWIVMALILDDLPAIGVPAAGEVKQDVQFGMNNALLGTRKDCPVGKAVTSSGNYGSDSDPGGWLVGTIASSIVNSAGVVTAGAGILDANGARTAAPGILDSAGARTAAPGILNSTGARTAYGVLTAAGVRYAEGVLEGSGTIYWTIADTGSTPYGNGEDAQWDADVAAVNAELGNMTTAVVNLLDAANDGTLNMSLYTLRTDVTSTLNTNKDEMIAANTDIQAAYSCDAGTAVAGGGVGVRYGGALRGA